MQIMRKIFLTGIGIGFQLLYFYLEIMSFMPCEVPDSGVSKSFAYMVFSIFALIPCLLFYLTDGIVAFFAERNRFAFLKLCAVTLCIPLAFSCIGYGVALYVLWNVHLIAVLVLETVSLFRRSQKDRDAEDSEPVLLSDLTEPLPTESERNCAQNTYTPLEIFSKILLLLGVSLQFCALHYAILAYGASDHEGPFGRFFAAASKFLTVALFLFLVEAILSYALKKRKVSLLQLTATVIAIPLNTLLQEIATLTSPLTVILLIPLCALCVAVFGFVVVSILRKPENANQATDGAAESLGEH